MAKLQAGEAPTLSELRLHNGTVYRWNRPIYDIVGDRPHLRVENRVLPAGPTILDVMANAAFYYGVIRKLAADDRPVWTKMSFGVAEQNFRNAARDGIDATLYWPGFGQVSVDELVLRHLLPLAHEGLKEWGVSDAVRERYLSVIEGRCKTGSNGATWQTQAVAAARGAGHGPPGRPEQDARDLPRPHAQQRARAHLAAALSGRSPAATYAGCPPMRAGSTSGWPGAPARTRGR